MIKASAASSTKQNMCTCPLSTKTVYVLFKKHQIEDGCVYTVRMHVFTIKKLDCPKINLDFCIKAGSALKG